MLLKRSRCTWERASAPLKLRSYRVNGNSSLGIRGSEWFLLGLTLGIWRLRFPFSEQRQEGLSAFTPLSGSCH